MANRESQSAGTRKIHHESTEIVETTPDFVNEQGCRPILSAPRASVLKDSQETHGEFDLRRDERRAEHAKQSQSGPTGPPDSDMRKGRGNPCLWPAGRI